MARHRDSRRARTADVVGVPLLPSGRVSVTANAARAVLGRLHSAMAPPPVRIVEGALALLDHRVLVALCEAGVPDALTTRVEIPVLAASIGVAVDDLERLVRFAAARGWVGLDRRGRVRPTAVTAFLRRDHPGGWGAWVEFVGGHEVTTAVAALKLGPSVVDPFAAANGLAFFDWMAAHPERGAVFDRAMAAGARMHALGLAAAMSWADSRRVCDVGGGTGDLLGTLLDLEPHLEGTVFDVDAVVARAISHQRLSALGGDAFVAVPSGFDTYLLVNVLHDWGDDECVLLLARIRDAMRGSAPPAGARVIVVESDRPVRPRNEIALSADVLMAALTPGGCERSTEAFEVLARRAGLSMTNAVRLASADVAHTFVAR